MLKLKKEWFHESPRKRIRKLVTRAIATNLKHQARLDLFDQPDQKVLYELSILNAENTFLMMVQYLAVDPKNTKPWIVRKPIPYVLEFQEFKEYILDVISWLSRQAPAVNYGSLVYLQAITKALNSMEITDE